ncbi:MAG: helix-turn-helix domain-containing protein [Bacteroidaceae bacterium]|nr:helix-turn-helix domain-containing protein [Bacteroidaceae bacterium]
MTTIDKIAALLEQKHLTQTQLSEFLGLKSYCLSEWRAGKTQSYKKHLEKIAEFLEVPVSYLLSDTDERPIHCVMDSGITYSSKVDSTTEQLLNVYNALSLSDKAKALTYVCELAEKQGE